MGLHKGADQLCGNSCVFVFAYAKSRFSHDVAQLIQYFAVQLCVTDMLSNTK